jgi:hypothetical protein
MKRIPLLARLSLVSMVMLALVTLGVGPTTGTALADTSPDKPNDVTQGRLRGTWPAARKCAYSPATATR